MKPFYRINDKTFEVEVLEIVKVERGFHYCKRNNFSVSEIVDEKLVDKQNYFAHSSAQGAIDTFIERREMLIRNAKERLYKMMQDLHAAKEKIAFNAKSESKGLFDD